jgi:hypothetical protein
MTYISYVHLFWFKHRINISLIFIPPFLILFFCFLPVVSATRDRCFASVGEIGLTISARRICYVAFAFIFAIILGLNEECVQEKYEKLSLLRVTVLSSNILALRNLHNFLSLKTVHIFGKRRKVHDMYEYMEKT